jgi:hypothetical protein
MLALNKIESNPWDIWPLMPHREQKDYPSDYLSNLDYMANISGSMWPNFDEIRTFYKKETMLHPPSDWDP